MDKFEVRVSVVTSTENATPNDMLMKTSSGNVQTAQRGQAGNWASLVELFCVVECNLTVDAKVSPPVRSEASAHV